MPLRRLWMHFHNNVIQKLMQVSNFLEYFILFSAHKKCVNNPWNERYVLPTYLNLLETNCLQCSMDLFCWSCLCIKIAFTFKIIWTSTNSRSKERKEGQVCQRFIRIYSNNPELYMFGLSSIYCLDLLKQSLIALLLSFFWSFFFSLINKPQKP